MLIALPHSQWSSTAPLVYGALSAPPVEKAEPSEKKTATISRVNRALSYGKGGYNIILEQLEK